MVSLGHFGRQSVAIFSEKIVPYISHPSQILDGTTEIPKYLTVKYSTGLINLSENKLL